MAKIVFGFSGCSRLNFSKSVNSFGPNDFFALFSFMWLSIAGVKLENEFAQQKFVEVKLRVMVVRNLEN